MRPLCFTYCVLAVPLVGCSSQTMTSTDAGATGATDATADTSSGLDLETAPDMHACTGDPSQCLFGSAEVFAGDAAAAQFAVTPTGLKVVLFRQFPATGIRPVDQQLVARNHTWAFSGLDAWAHYYVELDPGFASGVGISKTVATVVGPLAVPGAGAPVDVRVKPVQLDVFEASSGGASNQLEGATARLAEVMGGSSTVSLLVGNSEQTMPYDLAAQAYTVTFAQPPVLAAQPTYRITSSSPSASTANWQLVADPPTFTGTITQPPPGAVLPAGEAICVTWTQEPADYVAVELFKRDSRGSWISIYNSSPPEPADVPATSSCDGGGASAGATALTIPGVLEDGGVGTLAGSYLLNVSFTKANCPATADGCVHSSTVANELFTVQ